MATSTRVISARLTYDQIKHVTQASRAAGRTLSQHVRVCLTGVKLGDSAGDASYQADWVAVASALDLDPHDVGAVLAALEELMQAAEAAETPAPAADPTAESPAAPPAPAKLSRSELAACAKHGIEPSDYVARKAAAAHRHGKPAAPQPKHSAATLSAIKGAGLTVAEYETRKANAVRRNK